MTQYILTTAAEDDLRSIIRYTRSQWNEAQVRRYITKLEKGMVKLATGTGHFKDMSAIFPALRMALCEHHYVFCLPRHEVPALIVAIFHERMDAITRLEERLGS